MLLITSESSAQQTSDDVPGFLLETELLLDVLLVGQRLGITILAYQRDGQAYFSLAELMDAIRFPVNTDASTGQAGGWYIEEEREFLLDLNQGIVISGNSRFDPAGDVVVFENQIFVSETALEKWFPLELDVLIRQLAININPRELIPLQKGLQRRADRLSGAAGSSRNEPELPFQSTPFEPIGSHATDLRVNTSSLLRDGDDTSTSLAGNYSFISRGDLAWMTSTIALTGNDDDEVTDGRIKLERNLRRPFLDLDYVEIGDVETGNRGILVRGGGAERGNRGIFSGDSIDLRGDVPPDWEVELYRNGVLIDSQVVGGEAQYEFLGVPLEFGENVFEFVLFGPFGEQRRDERVVFAGDGLDFGEVSYTFSAVEDGESVVDGFVAQQQGTKGTGRYRADLNVGLGFSTTARLSVDSFDVDGDRIEDASLGISKTFAGMQASLGYRRTELGLDSATGQVRGRLGDNNRVTLRYTEFLTSGLDENLFPSDPGQWAFDAVVSSRLLNNPFTFNLNHDERTASNTTLMNLGTTIPTPWMRVSKSFFYQRDEFQNIDEERYGGSLNVTFDHEPWLFRSGTSYTLSPEAEFSTVFGAADIRLERRMSLNFDIRHRPLDDFTTYRMGLTWGLEHLQISPQVIYDSDERWVGLLSVSTSFNPRPGRYKPSVSRLSQANSGAAHVRAFIDDNGDGVWDDGETGLGGVGFEAVQSYRSARTADDGYAYITRLNRDRVTDIRMDPTTLPGLDLDSSTTGVSIRPRPGSWSTVDFPVTRTVELEGHVYRLSPGAQTPEPASRVLVKLLDQEGKVVSQQRTVFDGFYLFAQVSPGIYELVLKDELESRLVEKPGQVVVTSDGGVIRNLDFRIGEEKRMLISPPDLSEPSEVQPTSGPRIIPAEPGALSIESEALPEDDKSNDAVSSQTGGSGLDSESETVRQGAADRLTGGDWYVQFGAFGVADNATQRWQELQASGLVGDGQRPRYENVGSLVRLLTGNGLSEAGARTLCERVKSTGSGDCLVRKIEN